MELVSCRSYLFVEAVLVLPLLLEHMIAGVLTQVAELQFLPVEVGSVSFAR